MGLKLDKFRARGIKAVSSMVPQRSSRLRFSVIVHPPLPSNSSSTSMPYAADVHKRNFGKALTLPPDIQSLAGFDSLLVRPPRLSFRSSRCLLRRPFCPLPVQGDSRLTSLDSHLWTSILFSRAYCGDILSCPANLIIFLTV